MKGRIAAVLAVAAWFPGRAGGVFYRMGLLDDPAGQIYHFPM
jgi:hypothetical protein